MRGNFGTAVVWFAVNSDWLGVKISNFAYLATPISQIQNAPASIGAENEGNSVTNAWYSACDAEAH
jgi:hypothetical protein